MMKKLTLIVTALALMLGICACGSDGAGISVQRADQLAAAGQAGDRYAGMVVSENVVEIQRDSSKTVEELYVEVGQEVKAGDKLFSYDSDALELDLEKAQLVLYRNSEEVSRTDITLQPGEAPGSYELEISDQTVPLPELEEDDYLDLWLEVTLSDGRTLSTAGAGWFSSPDGLFLVVG